MPLIRNHKHFLIVGGGADNSLEELLNAGKTQNVIHVDISSVLSQKSRNRFSNSLLSGQARVQFVVAPFLAFNGTRCDGIIFPFYLDLFTDDEVRDNILHAKLHLTQNGLIYVIDYSSAVSPNSWADWKIKILYALFAPITKVNRSKIPDFALLFSEYGLTLVSTTTFYKGEYSVYIFKV